MKAGYMLGFVEHTDIKRGYPRALIISVKSVYKAKQQERRSNGLVIIKHLKLIKLTSNFSIRHLVEEF